MAVSLKILPAVFLLTLYLFNVRAAYYEGDACTKNGVPGVCTNINRCPSALKDIQNRKPPQICSFENIDPIVCCPRGGPTTSPPRPTPLVTTTTRTTTTTEYVPQVYDYVSNDDINNNNNKNPENKSDCGPVDPSLTSPRTSQKAWNKCLDYQEQLVYPCKKGVQLTGEQGRRNFCRHKADELIVGGTDADENEFPHMALLGYGEPPNIEWLCGGALISEKFVLTAGHCIASRDPVSYVTVGRLRRSDTAKKYKIAKIHRHPQFEPPSKYNDIALLETNEVIQLDYTTVPACLYVGDTVKDYNASATGWGLTAYNGQTSEVLQKVVLNKFTSRECSNKFRPMRLMVNGFDEQSQMCYGDKTQKKDTCQGDSGGPLQIKSQKIHCMYVVIGVTSFGRKCGTIGQPGIYTRVLHYLPWIERVVWPNN